MTDASTSVGDRIRELVTRFRLADSLAPRIEQLAASAVALEIAGTAIRDRREALDLHIADSLAGLELDAIRQARTLADIGTGIGFPGLAIALARPDMRVTLIDSVRKKVETAANIARRLELGNVECVWARVEEFSAHGGSGRESFDVVTARALAALPVLLEYAAPLLRRGGTLVAWKGDVSQQELASAQAAERVLGFAVGEVVPSHPFEGSARRHFYVATRQGPLDDRFPRRPGVASKRPLA